MNLEWCSFRYCKFAQIHLQIQQTQVQILQAAFSSDQVRSNDFFVCLTMLSGDDPSYLIAMRVQGCRPALAFCSNCVATVSWGAARTQRRKINTVKTATRHCNPVVLLGNMHQEIRITISFFWTTRARNQVFQEFTKLGNIS